MDSGLCSLSEFAAEEKAVLRVHVDCVSLDLVDEFRAACLRLLQTGMKHLSIDIGSLVRVPSGVVAAIIDLGMLARAGGEQLSVVVGPAAAAQFRLLDHCATVDLVVAQPGGTGTSAGTVPESLNRPSSARLSAPQLGE